MMQCSDLAKKVNKNRMFLAEQISYEDVRDYLRQEDVLSFTDDEDILSKTNSRDKISLLLDKLERKGLHVYKIFLDSIDRKEVVEKILITEIDITLVPDPRVPLRGEVTPREMIKLSGHNEVMTHWRRLAVMLGLQDSDVTEVAFANRDNLKEQAYQMLRKWHSHNYKGACTREAMYQALMDTGLDQAARDLESMQS